MPIGGVDVEEANQFQFVERPADPSSIADRGILYVKDVAGISELFYIDSAGTVVQITSGGGVGGGLWQRPGAYVQPLTVTDGVMIGSSATVPGPGQLVIEPDADRLALQINNAAGAFSLSYTTNATATNGVLTVSNIIEFDDVGGILRWDAGGGADIEGDGASGLIVSSELFEIYPTAAGTAQALGVYNSTGSHAIFSVDNTSFGKVLIQTDGGDIVDTFRVDNTIGTRIFSVNTNSVAAPGGSIEINGGLDMNGSGIYDARTLQGRAATVFTINTEIGSTTAQRDLAFQTSNEALFGTANVTRVTIGSGSTTPDLDLNDANLDMNGNSIKSSTNSLVIHDNPIQVGGNPSVIYGSNVGGEIQIKASTDASDLFPYYAIEGGTDVTAVLEENTTDAFKVSDSGITPDVLFLVQEQAAGLSTMAIGSSSGNTSITMNGTLTNNATTTNAGDVVAQQYAFVYDTNVQNISVANTFQAITFSNNGDLQGITHTATSADVVIGSTGTYEISYSAVVDNNAAANETVEFILTNNGTEITGSQIGRIITFNNKPNPIAKTILVDLTASDVINLEFASNGTDVSIETIGANATTAVSASISIRRVL